jgi:hypothetical protein
MAVCQWCRQEKRTGVSCTVAALRQQGTVCWLFKALRRCSDCGVGRGGLHHLGCKEQKCPCCARPLLRCDCVFDEEGVR